MKNLKTTFFSIFFLFTLAMLSVSLAKAQEFPIDQPESKNLSRMRKDKRPSLLRELNLTSEQVRQIRNINLETREQMREANEHLRQARRALDLAIYTDSPSEIEVEQRANELALAQSAMIKLRSKTEFRIRQVLTAEQLTRFQELRKRIQERINPTQGEPPFPPDNRPEKRFPPRS